MNAARALGSYYTPAALAEPLTRWAVRAASDSVLDPSCGDGAFLTQAVDRLLSLGADPRRLPDQVAGVELDPRALARANGALLSRHPGLRWSDPRPAAGQEVVHGLTVHTLTLRAGRQPGEGTASTRVGRPLSEPPGADGMTAVRGPVCDEPPWRVLAVPV